MTDQLRRRAVRYQWFIDYLPQSIEVLGVGRLGAMLGVASLIAGVLALPPVVEATGIPAVAAVGVMGAVGLWMTFVRFVLAPRAQHSARIYSLVVGGNLLMGIGAACLLPVLSGDPKTPLWMLAVVYASTNGGIQETTPSRSVLAAHVLGPLATTPLFLAGGASTAWSIAGPLLCALFSGVSYDMLARASGKWSDVRRERDEALALVRAQAAALQREHLARDLHDAVGSALGLLALHAELFERHADDPAQVRQLGALVRETARDGLGDLRGLLEALTPTEDTLDAIVAALRDLSARPVGAASVALTMVVETGGTVVLAPAVRLALVRVFQEALRNALVHGRPRRIDAVFRASDGVVALELRDDGAGFDPGAVRRSARGLAGMRARGAELGGSLDVVSAPGAGTLLRLRLGGPPKG